MKVTNTREAEQVNDVVHQFLMGGAEGALLGRREPQRAVHARALPNRADDARACGFVHGVHLCRGIADEVFRDFDVACLARRVENE
jgi:hypothetical protein